MRIAVALMLVCGCGPVRGTFEMGITSPIAVGATVLVKPSSSTTTRVGLTQTVRYDREVTIVSSSIEPADAWEKVECAECRGSVVYRALRENNGTITVKADDGLGAETFVKPIEAVMPTTVKLFVHPCEQLTYQAGLDFQLYLQLLRGTRVLQDSRFELGSFAVTGGATIEGVPSALWVKTGKASGVGRLTSTLDPGFAVPFTVFTPAEISAIDLVPFSPTVTTVSLKSAYEKAVHLSLKSSPASKSGARSSRRSPSGSSSRTSRWTSIAPRRPTQARSSRRRTRCSSAPAPSRRASSSAASRRSRRWWTRTRPSRWPAGRSSTSRRSSSSTAARRTGRPSWSLSPRCARCACTTRPGAPRRPSTCPPGARMGACCTCCSSKRSMGGGGR